MPLFNLRREYEKKLDARRQALREEGRRETQAEWEKWKAYHDANGRKYDNPPRLANIGKRQDPAD